MVIDWNLGADTRQEFGPMSADSHSITLVLASPQAACISSWLQKCKLMDSDGSSAQVLAALAAQLDDARWLGRWLREEARLAVAYEDCATLCQALDVAMRCAAPSAQEEVALKRLIAELERGSTICSP